MLGSNLDTTGYIDIGVFDYHLRQQINAESIFIPAVGSGCNVKFAFGQIQALNTKRVVPICDRTMKDSIDLIGCDVNITGDCDNGAFDVHVGKQIDTQPVVALVVCMSYDVHFAVSQVEPRNTKSIVPVVNVSAQSGIRPLWIEFNAARNFNQRVFDLHAGTDAETEL